MTIPDIFQTPNGAVVREVEELANVTYIGYSEMGEASNSKEWQIMKTSVSGSITSIRYAFGSWNDRAILNYK